MKAGTGTRTPRRLLPGTPWTAATPWSLQATPLIVLTLSLTLCGVGEGMLVQAALGSTPWTVLAQGLAAQSGWHLGWITFLVSLMVMMLWIPLRMRPGLGTVMNLILVALVLGVFVQGVPVPENWAGRIMLCAGGVALVGSASALYLSCHMGAGPRDGLMVGLCKQTGWRVGAVRSSLEITVCVAGWLLGGNLGLGTLLFACCVGWVVEATLAFLARHFAVWQPA